MKAERLLQVSLVALVALTSLMLAMGSGDVLVPLAATLLAASSIYLTDIRGMVVISPMTGNVLAVAAVLFSLRGFFRVDSESQLIAVAHLLVYLQVLLHYQRKYTRLYWHLLLLSLLQVVVATALNLGPLLGTLLFVYMFLALMALSLMFLRSESEPPSPSTVGPPDSIRPRGLEQAVSSRWPLTATPAILVGGSTGDLAKSLVGWSLFSNATRWGLSSLILAMIAFFLVPRMGRTRWYESSTTPQNVVGYTPQITLGELGETLLDTDLVMRVRFYDHKTGEPYPIDGLPLLRGSLLMNYNQGKWQRGSSDLRIPRDFYGSADDSSLVGIVRQEITIEPLDTPALFCVYPLVSVERNRELRFSSGRAQLVRTQDASQVPFSFNIGTTGLRNGRQWPVVPAAGDFSISRRVQSMQERGEATLRLLLQLPEDGLPLLSSAAAKVIDDSNIVLEDQFAKAMSLHNFLRKSGIFRYSLSGQRRDPKLDPIEDFVIKNPRGHCEYFATALCLMLRSQGIPARMVVGFKGDWNSLTGDYQVRQLNAHTWVEAYLRPWEIPEHLQLAGQDFRFGGWLTLDPTPEALESAGGESLSVRGTWRDLSDYVQTLWSNYVTRMDSRLQSEMIYEPITRTMRASWGDAWAVLMLSLSDFWNSWLHGTMFSWRGGLTAAAILLLLLALFGLLRVAIRWIRGAPGRRRRRRRTAGAAQVDFYRRWEELLARYGLHRSDAATPREFAAAVTWRFNEPTQRAAISMAPQWIAEAYYRVRFGAQALDKQEVEAIEQALVAAERILRTRPITANDSDKQGSAS